VAPHSDAYFALNGRGNETKELEKSEKDDEAEIAKPKEKEKTKETKSRGRFTLPSALKVPLNSQSTDGKKNEVLMRPTKSWNCRHQVLSWAELSWVELSELEVAE
jgi:hypothetical protein